MKHYSIRTEGSLYELGEKIYLDFAYGQILVRDGKGNKDRVTMLPFALKEHLQRHLEKVKALHEQDFLNLLYRTPYTLKNNYAFV